MGRVIYDNQRLIPAPFVQIGKTYNFADDGSSLGQQYNISLQGTLVAGKGSPTQSGLYNLSGYPNDETINSDQHLTNLIRKQEQLRGLFSNQGRWLEIQGDDGASPMKFQPTIQSIDFEQGNWYWESKYSINMTADRLFGAPSEEATTNLVSANENWSVEYDEQNQVYNISHTVSAQARPVMNSGVVSTSWLTAKDWVVPRLGQNNTYLISSGVLNLDTYFGGPITLYNLVRTEQIGVKDSSYSVTEAWIASNAAYTEEFTVTTQTNLDGFDQVSVEGTIQGYDIKDSQAQITTSKYENANTGWSSVQSTLSSRALSYSGLTYLHPTALSTSVARNVKNGFINYNYNYDTRPANCITGAKYENISIVDYNPGRIIAIIPILGRAAGPIIQDIGTYSEKRRQITIEALIPGNVTTCSEKLNRSKPNVDSIITTLTPAGTTYKTSDQETFDLSNGRYSRSVEFVY